MLHWPSLSCIPAEGLEPGVEGIAEHVVVERPLEVGLALDLRDSGPDSLPGSGMGVDRSFNHWHVNEVVGLVEGDEDGGNLGGVPRDLCCHG